MVQLVQEASLRQKHSASPSPSQSMAGAFRRARSRFEARSDASGLSRPGSAAPSAAPSAAASPQKPPRTPKMPHDQAQPVYEAYSPLMLGPPAARSVQWTAQPSPVRFVLQHPHLRLQHYFHSACGTCPSAASKNAWYSYYQAQPSDEACSPLMTWAPAVCSSMQ